MDIVAVIVIAAVAAIFVIILFHHAIRIKFERQFREQAPAGEGLDRLRAAIVRLLEERYLG